MRNHTPNSERERSLSSQYITGFDNNNLGTRLKSLSVFPGPSALGKYYNITTLSVALLTHFANNTGGGRWFELGGDNNDPRKNKYFSL